MKQIILKLISKIKKPQTKKKKNSKSTKKVDRKILKIAVIAGIPILAIGILAFSVIRNPGYFVVAKVNNAYITRSELNNMLLKTYGQQTLEDLAYKKIAELEFRKNNIVISPDELDQKLNEIEQSLGGMSLEDALSSSGMTIEELKENLILQLSLEKLLSDKVVVTEEDVKNFISQNAEQMKDMSEEEKNSYAQEQLKQQKLQMEMSTWFNNLRQNSEIKYFL